MSSPNSQKLLAKIGLKDGRPLEAASANSVNVEVGEDIATITSGSTPEGSTPSGSTTNLLRSDLLKGFPLFWSQLTGLLKKRLLHSVRDWRFFASVFVLPALLLIISMGLALLRPNADLPPLMLTPSIYGPEANSFIK